MILRSKIHSLILREVKESKNYKSIINDKRFKLFFNSIFVRRILEICGTHNCFLFDNKILKEFYNKYNNRIVINNCNKLVAVNIKNTETFRNFLITNGFTWMTGGDIKDLDYYARDNGELHILLNDNGKIQFSSDIQNTRIKNPDYVYKTETEIIELFNTIKENEIKYQNELINNILKK